MDINKKEEVQPKKLFTLANFVKLMLPLALIIALAIIAQAVYNTDVTTYKISDVDRIAKNRNARLNIVEERSKRNVEKSNLLIRAHIARDAGDVEAHAKITRQLGELLIRENELLVEETRQEIEAEQNEKLIRDTVNGRL